MQTRFLLGPAGSGKTFRCLEEIRSALKKAPQGAPLILLAPKQATFQLERQLLSDPNLPGYARLQIFSFERLADFILTKLQQPATKLLSEEGRVMVLRALLSQNKERLKIFRSSAKMPGFARQLSLLLRELQRHQLSPAKLFKLAEQTNAKPHLSNKLHDLALLMDGYFLWLKEHELQDANRLLDLATEALKTARQKVAIDGLWLDGFAEMTPQEINFLAALVPCCETAALAFCLDPEIDGENLSALSIWSVVNKTFQSCRARLDALPDCEIEVEFLRRDPAKNRFAQSAVLRYLESSWTKPKPFSDLENKIAESIRLASCANPENEAILAAHEILRFARNGGRFREAAVLLRDFDGYHDVLRRIFSRYEIPFFLDRRQSAAHHPLVELTRSALRMAAFNWEHDDWFCALKTGLVTDKEGVIDELENESLARGWKKEAWLHPLNFGGQKNFPAHLEKLREKVVPPFQKFSETLKKRSPNGVELCDAIRALWSDLKIEQQLESWVQTNPIHGTVWEQMQDWLKNISQAFPAEPMSVSEWLPVLESGWNGMTVGAIPPALDQVLIGTIDRSRNPDLRLVLVLGMNESVFPAPPKSGNLLTESDQAELANQDVWLGPNKLELLGRERFYGYIACTRARERLVLTCSSQDNRGRALNPSPFVSTLRQLFPDLWMEKFVPARDWLWAEHRCELAPALIHARAGGQRVEGLDEIIASPAFTSLLDRAEEFSRVANDQSISPALVEKLYGKTLHSSVSSLEQFAACPFRFFINAGLRAEERKFFELDIREQGSFQHDVLAKFHEELRDENKRWRDLSIAEARERIGRIAGKLKTTFRDGLLESDAQTTFAARSMTESLQEFITAIIGWMSQYQFDPHAVELGFGAKEQRLPSWEIDLGDDRKLAFRGIIDRVDICPLPGGKEALAVVMDYKSSAKQLDPVLLANGLQLQLPAYLALLKQLPNAEEIFGVRRLVPAGVFYVNLRGKFSGGDTREEILGKLEESRQNAYQHSGRFDLSALKHLDSRGETTGTQFKYRLKKDGEPYANSRDVMQPEDFARLLAQVEEQLVRIGREIFSGNAKIDPYQKGNTRACDQCDYQPICRIDPWTHSYRVLREPFAHSLTCPPNTQE